MENTRTARPANLEVIDELEVNGYTLQLVAGPAHDSIFLKGQSRAMWHHIPNWMNSLARFSDAINDVANDDLHLFS